MHDFCDCLKHFISQPLDLLFDDKILEKIFIIEGSNLLVNPETLESIRKMYPPIFWGFRNFTEIFATYYEDALNEKIIIDSTRQRISDEFGFLSSGMNMDLITSISAEPYESSQAEGMNMLLVPYPISVKSFESCADAVLFLKQQRIALEDSNVHAVRKQLNMAKDGCLLVGCSEVGEHFSFGIGTKSLLAKYPHIVFRKHVEWEFYVPPILGAKRHKNVEQSKHLEECVDSQKEKKSIDTGCRLRYKGGQIWFPLLDMTEAEVEKIKCIFSRDDCDDVIKVVLNLAKKQKKGTTILLTTKEIAQDEYHRLGVEYNRGFGLHHPYSISNPAIQDILPKLTAIDGAMLIDLEGQCWMCGTILDGEAKTEKSYGKIARGARYNSVPVYINSLLERQHRKHGREQPVPIAVLVASEDGMLDILT